MCFFHQETTDAEQEIQDMMKTVEEIENYVKGESEGLKKAQESIRLSEEKIGEAAIQKHKVWLLKFHWSYKKKHTLGFTLYL